MKTIFNTRSANLVSHRILATVVEYIASSSLSMSLLIGLKTKFLKLVEKELFFKEDICYVNDLKV
jgi:hypothetical protein